MLLMITYMVSIASHPMPFKVNDKSRWRMSSSFVNDVIIMLLKATLITIIIKLKINHLWKDAGSQYESGFLN